jgi:hypothetical protein
VLLSSVPHRYHDEKGLGTPSERSNTTAIRGLIEFYGKDFDAPTSYEKAAGEEAIALKNTIAAKMTPDATRRRAEARSRVEPAVKASATRNNLRPGNGPAGADAWKRTLAFLRKYLR